MTGWVIVGLLAVTVIVITIAALVIDRQTDTIEATGIPSIEIWPKDRIPLHFSVEPEVRRALPLIYDYLNFAADWWNKELGFEAFVPAGDDLRPTGDVIPVLPDTYIEGSTRDRSHVLSFVRIHSNSETGHVQSAAMYVITGMFEHAEELVIQRAMVHELGHLLGLDHDPDMPSSIMHPVSFNSKWLLTTADHRWVQRHYEPKEEA